MKFSSHPLPPTSTALDAVDEASTPCYFANGDLAEGYHTCDANSPVSFCCSSGYTCSSNALCVLTASDLAPGTVSRGACTEPRWNGKSCGGNCLDSEDATGGAGCHPVGDGGGERDCCAGGNAPGSCICSSNVAEVTLREAGDAQTILGRRAAPFSKTAAYPVGAKLARLHHASKTVSEDIVPTEAGSSEMFPGYSSWVRTSSSVESVPVVTPVTPPTWSGAWSETTLGGTEKPSEPVTTSQPGIITSPSKPSTETPITTTISIIASSLIHSASSPSQSSTSASISPSVPTVIPNFPDGTSSASANSSPEPATTSLATKLGLGLGIPLVVLAVAILTACIYRRQRRLRYAQAPPFDFDAPEMVPVSAADFAPAAPDYREHHHVPSRAIQQQEHQQQQQQQAYRHGPPKAIHTWSEWGTGASAGGEWTGTRAAAWGGGGGPYDDNQVGFVDRSDPEYHYPGGHDIQVSPPAPAPGPSPAPGYEDVGSPYEEDRGHAYQVPVVQVHQPQWTTSAAAPGVREPHQGQGQGQGRGLEQPPRRDVARVSRGLSVNEEVSPLSSTGSGMPYPRTSAISGMGWETNPRVSRG